MIFQLRAKHAHHTESGNSRISKNSKRSQLDFESGKNVLIGNNEAGKSTILLALDLALGGSRNRIEALGAEALLNKDSVDTFLAGEKSLEKLPELIVDVFPRGR
ncbi:AAA family ATPase [Pseudomonas sp. SST3]|uniref:AAA family ATPase n=1 Tax=Pseudomonas sp. SST3 TaxID=2267882 RepID=UPI001F512F41|nr:AAA family ATPase [Pseudomonas sp. SST3]